MDIVHISAHNPGPLTGPGNNTYLLVAPARAGDGARRGVLVDAGEGKAEQIRDLERALAERSASLDLVIVTHAHVDHISGCAAIRERWPRVRFGKIPWPDRDARYFTGFTPIRDDEVVWSDGGTLRVVHTPGHAPDHVCLVEDESRAVFCADLLQKRGTVVIPATAGGSLTRYLDSLDRIARLNPWRLYPAHGPVIDDPQKTIERTKSHRRQRERQVLAAVAGGHDTVEKVVAVVYANLEPALSIFAHETALAHLMKLEEEGRVERDSQGAWVLRI
jgi:glyoxylase-like metal-dependent hydrolase (beta-lactamase superfamily II)